MDELTLFIELLKIDDPALRRARLDEMAGNDINLRTRIDELLEAHIRASKFMDTSAHLNGMNVPSPVIRDVHREQPGDVIGPYKLLQVIGEGGMGSVFMAEQTKPVQRRVALKIIKAGMDSKSVIARFEAERQALAMMDHPNIAKVLDTGATDAGHPFFVMELVKGVEITKYCDEKRLNLKKRLELFISVCQAIQHAHQKGIIHRDIKPSNVLVAQYDGTPVPKVIDFGVAKATAQKLTERTLFTEFGQVIGTIEYMSPEQAELNQLDIDTRSDVYSLGVLLYELLTGSTPLDGKQLRSVAFIEMLRMIREEEPSKPSAKVSTSATLASIAASRGVEPERLGKIVKGELDWIVMKALDKDRTRRYQSATALAEDIQRYLNDEPVLAYPPTMIYRFRKSFERNKGKIVAGILLLLVLLGGIIGVTFGLVRAETARGRELEQRLIAQHNAALATENLKVAIAAVDEMYTEVSENWLRTTPRMQRLRRQILERALGFYQQIAKDNSKPSLQFELGLSWRRVGQIKHGFGEHNESVQALLESMSILEKLAAESRQTDRIRHELALTYSYCTKPLEVMEQFIEAEKYARLAVKIERELTERYSDSSDYRAASAFATHQLGHILQHLGRDEEALAVHRGSMQMYEELRTAFPEQSNNLTQLAHSHNHVANLLHITGDDENAENEYRIAISMLKDAALKVENNADVVNSPGILLGDAHYRLAVLLSSQNRNVAAEANYHESIKFIGEQANAFPDVEHYQGQLARSFLSLGKVLLADNRFDEAKLFFKKALVIFESPRFVWDELPEYLRLIEEAKFHLTDLDRKETGPP